MTAVIHRENLDKMKSKKVKSKDLISVGSVTDGRAVKANGERMAHCNSSLESLAVIGESGLWLYCIAFQKAHGLCRLSPGTRVSVWLS